MKDNRPRPGKKTGKKPQPKVKIPLPFEKAVEGLLAVKPEKGRKPS